MSSILMVVAPKDYQDNEFEVPRDAFTAAGHTVHVASKATDIALGVLGGSTKVDVHLSEVDPSSYDAVVIAGGGGSAVYFNDESVHELVRKFEQAGSVVAAICISPSTLANAGLLEGKSATAFPTEKDNLIAKGATWTGTDVEVDGNIVTANGPSSASRFADEILKLLSK